MVKRFIAVVCVVLLLVAVVPVPAHADLGAAAAASVFQMWAQSYGMSVGGATFGFDGVDSTEADTWITDIFNDWQRYEVQHGQSSALSLSDFIASYGLYALTEKVYTGPNPIGSAYSTMLNIGEVLSEQLGSFWNWYLTTLQFTYDNTIGGWISSLFSDDNPITIFSTPTAGPIYQTLDGVQNSFWTRAGTINNGAVYVASTLANTYCVGTYNDAGNPRFYFISPASNATFYVKGSVNLTRTNNSYSDYNGTRYWYSLVSYGSQTVNFPMVDNVLGEANQLAPIRYVDGILNGTVDNTGADISLEAYGELGDDDQLSFPNVSYPEYEPQAVSIPLSVPWESTWDTLPQEELAEEVAADAQTRALVNDLTIVEPMDTPAYPDTDVIGPVGDYVVPGLGSVFPFCIPFDIYNFLSALASPPQAPVFSCTLAFPEAFGGPQTIELDFDTPVFNQLAQLLRLLELLAFIVGLAFVTRSMFIRG